MGVTDMLKFANFVLIMILSSHFCFAQPGEKSSIDKNFWLTPTAGFLFGAQSPGFFADFSVEYSVGESIYSVQYFDFYNYSNLFIGTDTEKIKLSGISILYGEIERLSFSKVTYSAGLSIIKHTTNIENIYKSKLLVCLYQLN